MYLAEAQLVDGLHARGNVDLGISQLLRGVPLLRADQLHCSKLPVFELQTGHQFQRVAFHICDCELDGGNLGNQLICILFPRKRKFAMLFKFLQGTAQLQKLLLLWLDLGWTSIRNAGGDRSAAGFHKIKFIV